MKRQKEGKKHILNLDIESLFSNNLVSASQDWVVGSKSGSSVLVGESLVNLLAETSGVTIGVTVGVVVTRVGIIVTRVGVGTGVVGVSLSVVGRVVALTRGAVVAGFAVVPIVSGIVGDGAGLANVLVATYTTLGDLVLLAADLWSRWKTGGLGS